MRLGFEGKWALAVLLVAALFVVGNRGIEIGNKNHVGLIPVVRRIVDPNYLPGDFGIELRAQHHRIFARTIATLSRAVGEDAALIALSLAGFVLIAAALLALTRALGVGLLGYLGLSSLVAFGWLSAGEGLEANQFLGAEQVQPPIFAHAALVFAIVAAFYGRSRLAAFLVGLAFTIHIQVGLIAVLVALPLLLGLRFWRAGPKEIALALAAGLVAAAPGIVNLVALSHQGTGSGRISLAHFNFRYPHHVAVSAGAAAVVGAHLAVLCLLAAHLRRTGSPVAGRARALAALGAGVAVLSALHVLAYYVLGDAKIVAIQFVRVSPFVTVFAPLVLFAAAGEWAARPCVRLAPRLHDWLARPESRRARIAALAACAVAVLVAAGVRFHAIKPTGRFPAVTIARDEPDAWSEARRWIRANGPRGTVYLTPPGNEGFVYAAERSNVAEFKIDPDGGIRLQQWYERLRDLAGGDLPHERGLKNEPLMNRAYARLTREQLLALARKYGAGCAVLPTTSDFRENVLYENARYRVVRLDAP